MVQIKSIRLQNFKGVKSAEYNFDGKNITIKGQNGAGKSTIADAYFWVMADKSYDLVNNPNIRPLEVEECTPRVEIVFDIDGKEVAVAKIQKQKSKEVEENGQKKMKVSLDNSYEVNSIPMGLKAFNEKMQEYGFDFKKFMQLSHPDTFTANMSVKKEMESIRNTLFEMANSHTDLQIAEMLGSATEVEGLLKDYSMEEIRAKQNAIKREINECYGVKGEKLQAKIEGMEQTKTDIDIAELELLKKTLNEQISENKAEQDDVSKQFEEQQKASDGVLELNFKLNELQQEENLELEKKRREIRTEIDDTDRQLKQVAHQVRLNKQDIQTAEDSIKSNESRIQAEYGKWTDCDNELKAVEKHEFDENSLVCSYCGQEYPVEKKEQLRADFEAKKKEKIEQIENDKTATEKRGKELRAAIEKDKAEIEQLKAVLKENENEEINLNETIKGLEKRLAEIPQSIDISDSPEAQEIKKQIAEKEQAMQKGNSAEDIRQNLRIEMSDLQNQLIEVEKQFALAKKNIEIDEQIAALRKKQKEYEQNRADCERILDQLDLVSKRKNELLSEEVNSHFKLVKFRLFDYLKNGTVVDDCTPIIDGKSINDHSNGALRVLAKLDIIDGLQKFYGQSYPVFVDDFSLVTDNTECRIDVGCQLIKLIAEKGIKELMIEMGG